MKLKRFATVLLTACVIWFTTREAQAFYNPTTGRWLNRDPIGERGDLNVYGFVRNDGIGDVDILGKRKTRFSLTEMQQMLNRSKEAFRHKLSIKCPWFMKSGSESWLAEDGRVQCCDWKSCFLQADLLALRFARYLEVNFTTEFQLYGDVIAFADGVLGWSDNINDRADRAPGNGMRWRDYDQGHGLKCQGMQTLIVKGFKEVIQPFSNRGKQCFKGAEVGNNPDRNKASHHWFGIYLGVNNDKARVDVEVDPWLSAGGIISPDVPYRTARYFDTLLW